MSKWAVEDFRECCSGMGESGGISCGGGRAFKATASVDRTTLRDIGKSEKRVKANKRGRTRIENSMVASFQDANLLP